MVPLFDVTSTIQSSEWYNIMIASKKRIAIFIGILFLLCLIVAAWVARSGYGWENHDSRYSRNSYEVDNLFENTAKKIVTTDTGASIEITFWNTGSLSKAHALFELMKWSPEYINTAFTLTSMVVNDTLVVAISSSIPDIVSFIHAWVSEGGIKSWGFNIEFLSNWWTNGNMKYSRWGIRWGKWWEERNRE